MARDRIVARAVGGAVIAHLDAETARDVAEALSMAYATCDDLEQERPWWFDDVIVLFTAAAQADVQAGKVPTPVLVPLIQPATETRPALRLVAGGDPA